MDRLAAALLALGPARRGGTTVVAARKLPFPGESTPDSLDGQVLDFLP